MSLGVCGGVSERRSAPITISRGRLFAGVLFLDCANGVSSRVITAIRDSGWLYTALDTFHISLIVWIPIFCGNFLLARSFPEKATVYDWAVGAVGILCAVVPFVPLSWLALTAIAIWLMRGSLLGSPERRATSILLTVALPMFWSPWLFRAFARYVLAIDAMLVSTVLGSTRQGNVVAFADGTGHLAIYHGCSSVANVSLAVLAWVSIGHLVKRPTTLASIGWCVAACIAVVTVNVLRISLIGFYPNYYTTIHGPFGATIAGWLTLALILACVAMSARRELKIHL